MRHLVGMYSVCDTLDVRYLWRGGMTMISYARVSMCVDWMNEPAAAVVAGQGWSNEISDYVIIERIGTLILLNKELVARQSIFIFN